MTASQPPAHDQDPEVVFLYKYEPSKKQGEGEYVRYVALVIGVRQLEGHDEPVLQTVHFKHNDIASHHALTGVDWADCLERTLDVAHKDDVRNQSFYYLNPWEENRRPVEPSSDDLDRDAEDKKAASGTGINIAEDKDVTQLNAVLADYNRSRGN